MFPTILQRGLLINEDDRYPTVLISFVLTESMFNCWTYSFKQNICYIETNNTSAALEETKTVI